MTVLSRLLGVVLLAVATALPAQVVRGVVRSQATSLEVERARVSALDGAGRVLAEVTSDDRGRFVLRVDARGAPFSVTIRRIGFEVSNTEMLRLAPGDTVDFEFLVPENAVVADTVRVRGMASMNESRLDEARRRGWKIMPPELVAKHRDQVNNIYDLLRWAGANSLIIPNRPNECVRSARYFAGDRRNDRCMVWVVDGQVLGPTPILNPADTYFMAVLTASESAVEFGDKALWGAIVVVTRMHGDKQRP